MINAIKANFKSKPIVIAVAEELDATAYLMSSPANKAMLHKSLVPWQVHPDSKVGASTDLLKW